MEKLPKFMLPLIRPFNFKIIYVFLVGVVMFSCYRKEIPMTEHIVSASCGQCQFNMTEKVGCDLAIKIDGKPYFVKGASIDQHGDAHAENGFCNTVRTAKVTGFIKDDKFITNFFELID